MSKLLNYFYIALIFTMVGYGWRMYHETLDCKIIKQSKLDLSNYKPIDMTRYQNPKLIGYTWYNVKANQNYEEVKLNEKSN